MLLMRFTTQPDESGKSNIMTKKSVKKILPAELNIINIGLKEFYEQLERQGVKVCHLDWSPPAGGDPKLGTILSKLS